jgi:protein-S-isoprenylcysteine O-methyltransferase Ste14
MAVSEGSDMPDESANSAKRQEKLWTFGRILQIILFLAIWIGGTFVSAGTVWWLRGWIFTIGALVLYTGGTIWVMRKNPALLPARAQWHFREMRPFDRVFIGLLFPLYLAQPILAGLDAVRYRWTSMPFWTVYAGMFLLACGMGIVTWAMLVNPFAEAVVRIQQDRKQTTVTTGPYEYVRHPMYFGAIAMFLATGLVFGSWWAMVIGLAMSLLFVWRTAMEDGILMHDLPGYREFATRTPYRLIPGLW